LIFGILFFCAYIISYFPKSREIPIPHHECIHEGANSAVRARVGWARTAHYYILILYFVFNFCPAVPEIPPREAAAEGEGWGEEFRRARANKSESPPPASQGSNAESKIFFEF